MVDSVKEEQLQKVFRFFSGETLRNGRSAENGSRARMSCPPERSLIYHHCHASIHELNRP
jgi:hypothetical protein